MVTGLMSIPAVMLFIASLFIPDSPFHLVEKESAHKQIYDCHVDLIFFSVQQGQLSAAETSLRWLRGPKYNISAEFGEIVAKKEEKERERNEKLSKHNSLSSTLLTPEFLWPLLKIGFLMILSECGGLSVVNQYMIVILDKSGSSIDPTLAPIVVVLIRLGMAVLSAIVLR